MALTTYAPRKTVHKNMPSTTTKQYRKHHPSRTFYLFISPWLVGFVLLTVLPLGYAFLISFTNFDGITQHWKWVGLSNYIEVFVKDPDALYSLGRTLIYTVITVPLSVAGGLGLAVLLNQRIHAVGLFRTIFYLPSIVPVVASALMWKLIFDRDAGALNAILERFGGQTVAWLVDPMAFTAMIILVLWGMGGGMVISLAGLQGIPAELREAARVDGANPWQTFVKITLPMLSPVLFFQVITGIIFSLQTFIQPLLLTTANGGNTPSGVPRGNYLYMLDVYQQFLYNQRFGYGSAMLWILFVIILAFTLLVFRSSSFWVYYEVDQNA